MELAGLGVGAKSARDGGFKAPSTLGSVHWAQRHDLVTLLGPGTVYRYRKDIVILIIHAAITMIMIILKTGNNTLMTIVVLVTAAVELLGAVGLVARFSQAWVSGSRCQVSSSVLTSSDSGCWDPPTSRGRNLVGLGPRA